jgi:hypothetical protein
MSDLLRKNGDSRKFPDDDWREILNVNGFAPSGVREEVWRSPHSDLKVMIDVDRDTEEPYYQVITEDGHRSAKWTDAEALKSIVEPKEEEALSYVASEKTPVEITDDDLPEGFFSDKPFEQQRREKELSWEPDYKKMPKSALLAPDLKGWPKGF